MLRGLRGQKGFVPLTRAPFDKGISSGFPLEKVGKSVYLSAASISAEDANCFVLYYVVAAYF